MTCSGLVVDTLFSQQGETLVHLVAHSFDMLKIVEECANALAILTKETLGRNNGLGFQFTGKHKS